MLRLNSKVLIIKGLFTGISRTGTSSFSCFGYICTMNFPEPTVAIYTLGCKLNYAESSTIGRQLAASGYRKIPLEEKPDVAVINTCSVTENADRECRMIVRRILASNPATFIAVIGCYAQLKPNEIASIPGVDLVLGASEKFRLPVFLKQIHKNDTAEVHSCEISDAGSFFSSYSSGDRTRAFLKVQDGCDYPCTYCTIPRARGSSRSDSIQGVLARAEEIAASGIREIVLTGVNIGDFGKSPDGKDRVSSLTALLYALESVEGIERIRISSIEPNLLTGEIIRMVSGSKKITPHFHIPLQSGSDRILALMKRRYKTDLYRDKVNQILSELPEACIGADVITGFPGETEDHFRETLDFLKDLDVSYLHVFTYSERDNTPAAHMEGTVPVAERKRRNAMLRILSEKKRARFYNGHMGTFRPVLWEADNHNGLMHGFTDNYIRISRTFDALYINSITLEKISALTSDGSMSVEGGSALHI